MGCAAGLFSSATRSGRQVLDGRAAGREHAWARGSPRKRDGSTAVSERRRLPEAASGLTNLAARRIQLRAVTVDGAFARHHLAQGSASKGTLARSFRTQRGLCFRSSTARCGPGIGFDWVIARHVDRSLSRIVLVLPARGCPSAPRLRSRPRTAVSAAVDVAREHRWSGPLHQRRPAFNHAGGPNGVRQPWRPSEDEDEGSRRALLPIPRGRMRAFREALLSVV